MMSLSSNNCYFHLEIFYNQSFPFDLSFFFQSPPSVVFFFSVIIKINILLTPYSGVRWDGWDKVLSDMWRLAKMIGKLKNNFNSWNILKAFSKTYNYNDLFITSCIQELSAEYNCRSGWFVSDSWEWVVLVKGHWETGGWQSDSCQVVI